jgi:tetratricopeptide (TPR) repeat protein
MPDPTLRETLESAVAAQEDPTIEAGGKTVPAPADPAPPEPQESEPPAGDEPSQKPAVKEPEGEVPPEIKPVANDAPKSWKAQVRGKWADLPTDVKEEVVRREREHAKTFGDNAQARQFHSQFTEVVRPYEARIRSGGMNPIEAVKNLLEYDYALATAPAAKRAQLAAKLIKDYEVDIRELDAALAGAGPVDSVAATVERLVAERLGPVQSFIMQQQQMEAARNQAYAQEAEVTVETMLADTATFPHFEQVRETMADLVEVSAKRGVYIDAKTAYNRAVAMDPDLGAQAVARTQSETQRLQAQAAHARAQKALQASASVRGTPSGTPGSPGSGSLRDTIEAAFDSVTTR